MIRVLFALALIATPLVSPSASALADGGAILRDRVLIDGDRLLLGDLFFNAGGKADVAIANAPAPGQQIVVGARVLYQLAQAHGLDWKPASVRDRAIVLRDSTVVTTDAIRAALLDAFSARGLDPELTSIEFSQPGLRFHLPVDADTAVGVEDLVYDPHAMTFRSVLSIGGAGLPSQRVVRVGGRAYSLTRVPVLNRRMTRDEVMDVEDVSWIKMRSHQLPRNAVVSLDDIVGMAPRHVIQADQPIRHADVQRPKLVKKGDLVLMVLTNGGMRLSAPGRALADGGEGDMIRVSNPATDVIVEAMVTGPKQVAVFSAASAGGGV